MSFGEILEKIQNKPRYIRIQILWASVIFCMIGIVYLWVGSFSGSFLSIQKASIGDGITRPFKEIKEEMPSLRQVFKDSVNTFFELGEEVEEEKTIEPELGRKIIEKEGSDIPGILPLP